MTDWGALRDASGSAAELPALLDRLDPDPDAEVWEELYSRLYHQGTVYPASFAALPALERAARAWPPGDRSAALILAAAIVASNDFAGPPEELTQLRGHAEPLVPRFLELALECLARADHSTEEFVYLLEAARALDGDLLWGRELHGLADGEFQGRCPRCGASLYLVIGEDGAFTAAEEWFNRPSTPRESIEAAGAMPAAGQWMREQARAVRQTEIDERLPFVFGTSRCPGCKAAFSVPDALRADG